MNDNIVSTAYSKYAGTARNRPCVDTATGLANPLMSMSVAASGGWNIKGGTFGFTRVDKKKNKKFHNGIDLAAEPGTPIYSMYDGVVSSSHYVVEQPDRVKNKYPDGYSGDKNDAGNRIFIASEIGEETVYLGYWHLQSGTPVAINPRTGVPFAPGDQVYQGEVIAYTGITGNATPDKAPESHLHLAAKVGSMDSSYVDPSPYINGTINTTQREITHIICN